MNRSDYVIATGVTTTIRDFIKLAAAEIGLEVAFRGEGINEKGYIVQSMRNDSRKCR